LAAGALELGVEALEVIEALGVALGSRFLGLGGADAGGGVRAGSGHDDSSASSGGASSSAAHDRGIGVHVNVCQDVGVGSAVVVVKGRAVALFAQTAVNVDIGAAVDVEAGHFFLHVGNPDEAHLAAFNVHVGSQVSFYASGEDVFLGRAILPKSRDRVGIFNDRGVVNDVGRPSHDLGGLTVVSRLGTFTFDGLEVAAFAVGTNPSGFDDQSRCHKSED